MPYDVLNTSDTNYEKPVPTWQIAVMALTICIGFITYGYNIMKGEFEDFPDSFSRHALSPLSSCLTRPPEYSSSISSLLCSFSSGCCVPVGYILTFSQSWATKSPTTLLLVDLQWNWALRSPFSSSRSTSCPFLRQCASLVWIKTFPDACFLEYYANSFQRRYRRCWTLQWYI